MARHIHIIVRMIGLGHLQNAALRIREGAAHVPRNHIGAGVEVGGQFKAAGAGLTSKDIGQAHSDDR